MAPVEFSQSLIDFDAELTQKRRFEMEMMRLQTMYFCNLHYERPISNPRLFMPFDWEILELEVPTEQEWSDWDVIVRKLKDAKKLPLNPNKLKNYGL